MAVSIKFHFALFSGMLRMYWLLEILEGSFQILTFFQGGIPQHLVQTVTTIENLV